MTTLQEFAGDIAQMEQYMADRLGMAKSHADVTIRKSTLTYWLHPGFDDAWDGEQSGSMVNFREPIAEAAKAREKAWAFLQRQPGKEERDLKAAMRDLSGLLEKAENYAPVAKEIVQARIRAAREELAAVALPPPAA